MQIVAVWKHKNTKDQYWKWTYQRGSLWSVESGHGWMKQAGGLWAPFTLLMAWRHHHNCLNLKQVNHNRLVVTKSLWMIYPRWRFGVFRKWKYVSVPSHRAEPEMAQLIMKTTTTVTFLIISLLLLSTAGISLLWIIGLMCSICLILTMSSWTIWFKFKYIILCLLDVLLVCFCINTTSARRRRNAGTCRGTF